MYHVYKRTRNYYGEPYCSYTSNCQPAEFDSLHQAILALNLFQKINPVGWLIYDSKTLKQVNIKMAFSFYESKIDESLYCEKLKNIANAFRTTINGQ